MVSIAFVLLSSLLVGAEAEPVAPRRPFPQHTSYAADTILPDHRTRTELDGDVRDFYDYWKKRYLLEAPGPRRRYRVSYGKENPARTVSEGQGYGMVIVALMAGHDPAAREYFDGLWAFARSHPSKVNARLMAWEIPEPKGGTDCAFDGDADIALGLLLADAQWGSGGEVDYKAEALGVIGAMKESLIGPESRLPLLGDWIDPEGRDHNQYTPRSSDFMPSHFRAYARATGDGVWGEVASACQRTVENLQTEHSPKTGLLPDFIQPVSAANHAPRPATARFLEGPQDGRYFYNAGRVPWRLGTDALLSGDPASLAQTRRLAAWIARTMDGEPANIKAGYRLDGKPLARSDYFTSLFAAPFGVALMTRAEYQTSLNAVYDAVRTAHEDYYADSVTLQCLLVMTGNYWAP